jgi:cytochrome b involved in lipid metabolism
MIAFSALDTFSELSNSQQLLRTSWRSCLSTSWELLSCWEFLEVVVQSFLKKSMIWKKQKNKKKICLSVVCSLSVSLSVCFGDLELAFEHLRQLWSLSLWFTVSNFLGKMATETKKLFQFSEVETHANPTDCWLIIHGKVNCVLQLHSSFFLSFLIYFP